MVKKQIKIKFTNGLDFATGIKDILNFLSPYYEFIDSHEPEFIIFGPYGNSIPLKGRSIRIGYFCENMMPDMSMCDWAFGVPYEEEIQHPRYIRIQWHGFNPACLIKQSVDVEAILAKKTKFCNFIYSNIVPFREEFCRKLSKYKAVDAPGRSLNNMLSIDKSMPHVSRWERKRKFLSEYKFTIAFENYSYPGYSTEKLLDPMMVNSLPIYLGNPSIDRHFNPKSFINAHDHIQNKHLVLANFLESSCQPDWQDNCPSEYVSFEHKVKRKVKSVGRSLKMQLKYNSFDELIDTIIEIDRDDNLYAKYLSEPWFYDNTPPSNNAVIERWKTIFG
jgi:alpha(1,3/1,4) fucosyltransferase